MNYKSVILGLACMCFGVICFGQQKQLEKANKHYKSMRYHKAIPLYKEVLLSKESTNTKSKLAYCYRMTNQIDSAVALYAEIVEEKRARPITYYYYGETLMSIGDYENAKKWFLKYAEEKPTDERPVLMAEACDKVKLIKPVYLNVNVMPLDMVNTPSDDGAPVIWDGHLVYVSDDPKGTGLFHSQYDWTGRDFLNLYFSKINEDSFYVDKKGFYRKINESEKNIGSATFSADGNTIYFTRNSDVPSGKNTYNMQIYTAKRVGKKWKKIKLMPFCHKNHNYMHPTISADGHAIYYACDKRGGEGGMDIYVSHKTSKGWSKGENLGADINTSAHEAFPFIDGDSTLYFASKGHIGFGGFDIFQTKQNELGYWSNPVNIGMPLNSPKDDLYFYIHPEEKEKGFFVSNRKANHDDIYAFHIFDLKCEGVLAINENDTLTEEMTINLVSDDGLKNEYKIKDGKYSFDVLANKDYTVTIKRKGFAPYKEKLSTIGASENQTISLSINDLSKLNSPLVATIDPSPKTGMAHMEEESLLQTICYTIKDKTTNKLLSKVALLVKDKDGEQQDVILTGSLGQVDLKLLPQVRYEIKLVKKDYFVTTAWAYLEVDSMIQKNVELRLDRLEVNKIIEIEDLEFDEEKFFIRTDAEQELDKLVVLLKDNPSLQISIENYTKSKNSDLSKNRARAIIGYLVAKGIEADKLSFEGHADQANDKTFFKVIEN